MPAPKLTENPVIIEMNDVAVGSLENPEIAVLEDVTWSVAAGEYWVIGGMQGSGKSDFDFNDRRFDVARSRDVSVV